MSRFRVSGPGGGFRYVPVDRMYVRYLLRPQELFARSYAQLVAMESQNADFLTEMAILRATRGGLIKYPAQWRNDDFMAIRESLLRAIMEMKWRK